MNETGMPTGMQKLQDEWQLMSRYIDRVTAERDEARAWCWTMLVIILLLSMALGYVLAQGVI